MTAGGGAPDPGGSSMALSCPALLNGAPQLAEPEPGGNLPGFRARKLRSRKSGVILRDPGKQGKIRVKNAGEAGEIRGWPTPSLVRIKNAGLLNF